jgi:hypothetical protein
MGWAGPVFFLGSAPHATSVRTNGDIFYISVKIFSSFFDFPNAPLVVTKKPLLLYVIQYMHEFAVGGS